MEFSSVKLLLPSFRACFHIYITYDVSYDVPVRDVRYKLKRYDEYILQAFKANFSVYYGLRRKMQYIEPKCDYLFCKLTIQSYF